MQLVHLNQHLDVCLPPDAFRMKTSSRSHHPPTKTIILSASMHWTYHQPPTLLSSLCHAIQVILLGSNPTFARFGRFWGSQRFVLASLAVVICFGSFVCNLRTFRRFWRSLQTAEKNKLPPIHCRFAVLAIISVCNLRMFHRFWRFRLFRLLQISVVVVFVFNFATRHFHLQTVPQLQQVGPTMVFLRLEGGCHNDDDNMLERVQWP